MRESRIACSRRRTPRWVEVKAGRGESRDDGVTTTRSTSTCASARRAASRNATVTVTGGGFTRGTAGGIKVGENPNVGTYTVDSSGKLSGSFVAGGRTRTGGPVSITDLGTGVTRSRLRIRSTQRASATPTTDEVALGAPVQVTLNDFTPGAAFTAVIAGDIPRLIQITLTTYSGAAGKANSYRWRHLQPLCAAGYGHGHEASRRHGHRHEADGLWRCGRRHHHRR